MRVNNYGSAEEALASLCLGSNLDRQLVRQLCMDLTTELKLKRLGGGTTHDYVWTLFVNMLNDPFGKRAFVAQESKSRNVVVFSDVYHMQLGGVRALAQDRKSVV